MKNPTIWTRAKLFQKLQEIARECGVPDSWVEQGTPSAPVLVAFYPECTLVLDHTGRERWA